MIVTDAAFPYLVLQQGRLDHLKADRAAWEAAYAEKMAALFEDIRPFLPAACARTLDVGSGMGGINALIARHYGGEVRVALLDGYADAPVMARHAETFSHFAVAAVFLQANGVRHISGLTPDYAQAGQPPLTAFDLITSFGSWCFHYPPAVYLPFVTAHCHPDTMLIVEVRNDRPEWLDALMGPDAPFMPIGAGEAAEKFTRWAMKPRG